MSLTAPWKRLIVASLRKRTLVLVFGHLVLHRSRGPIESARPAHGCRLATPPHQGMDIQHMEAWVGLAWVTCATFTLRLCAGS